MEDNTKEFYVRLKSELEKNTTKWPSEYLYKFIVPAVPERIKQVEEAFDGMGAVIKKTNSKTGKFTSVSISVIMPSADAIIQIYQQVSTIEGIISL